MNTAKFRVDMEATTLALFNARARLRAHYNVAHAAWSVVRHLQALAAHRSAAYDRPDLLDMLSDLSVAQIAAAATILVMRALECEDGGGGEHSDRVMEACNVPAGRARERALNAIDIMIFHMGGIPDFPGAGCVLDGCTVDAAHTGAAVPDPSRPFSAPLYRVILVRQPCFEDTLTAAQKKAALCCLNVSFYTDLPFLLRESPGLLLQGCIVCALQPQPEYSAEDAAQALLQARLYDKNSKPPSVSPGRAETVALVATAIAARLTPTES